MRGTTHRLSPSDRLWRVTLFGAVILLVSGTVTAPGNAAQTKKKAQTKEKAQTAKKTHAAKKTLTDGAKSSPAAFTAYSDAANYQSKMAFELAAEEWAQFLKRFGDDPLAAKAQHYRGVCLVQLKQFVEAINAFQAVLSKYPKFDLLEETYLNLGWSQYSLGQAGDKNRYAQAVETFGKLEAAFPQGKYVDQALFFKAESLYALGKKKDSAMTYGKLVMAHRKSKLRADALYALGVTLEEMAQWKQAKKSYEMYLADYAKKELATEVRMRLAESILQAGDAKAAAAMFAEVAGVSGFSAADHAMLRQAYSEARQGKDLEAAKLYASLVERFPKSANVPEASISAARSFFRANQDEEAIKWFDRVLAAGGPGAIEATHWRCRIYLRNKQIDEALRLAAEKLATAGDDPFVPNLRLDKADALYETAASKEAALKEYVALAEAFPKHEVGPTALYNAAFAALELKHYDQATELAGRFLAAYPGHELTPDVRYIVAECKVQTKAYEQAEAIYRQIAASVKDHPALPLWRVRMGLVLFLQKKYQEAIDLLTPLAPTLQDPALKAEALYLIGVSQFELKQFEVAAGSLQAALSADSQWRQADETLLYLARAQKQMNQLPKAIASLAALIKDFPKSVVLDQAYYYLGEYNYAENRFQDANTAYEKVLKEYGKSPFVPYALYGTGWSRMKAGEFERAIAVFTTLIDEHATHELKDDALFARGMCYRQAKQYTEAIADINNYLLDNEDAAQRADALYERGLAEALARQFQKAAKTYATLLEQNPDYANADKVLYELAWAQKSQSDEAGAAKTFAMLAEKYADSPLAAEARFHVGENAYSGKDYSAAVKAYQQATKTTNNALHEKAAYKLGWSYYQQKQYREALVTFEQLLKTHAAGALVSDAWFMKAECLFQLKDFKKALPAYREAITHKASSPQIAVLRQLHAGQTAAQLEQWQESVTLLDPLIADHADSFYLAEAAFERGQAKLKLKQAEDAIKDFRQAAEKSRGVVGTRAQFMVGEVEFQQKRYDDAIKDFQRTMFRTVPDDAPAELRNWQAKAGYEAGRCSEVQIADAKSAALRAKRIADAKKFYQYVITTHAEHELAPEAKKRLAALAKLVP